MESKHPPYLMFYIRPEPLSAVKVAGADRDEHQVEEGLTRFLSSLGVMCWMIVQYQDRSVMFKPLWDLRNKKLDVSDELIRVGGLTKHEYRFLQARGNSAKDSLVLSNQRRDS